MAGGKVFEAFHADELMHMVSGMQDFNFKDLETITEYQNGYHAEHPVIKLFWEVGNFIISFLLPLTKNKLEVSMLKSKNYVQLFYS